MEPTTDNSRYRPFAGSQRIALFSESIADLASTALTLFDEFMTKFYAEKVE